MSTRVVAVAAVLVGAVLAGCEPTGKAEPTIEPSAPPSPSITQSLAGPGCATYLKKYANGPASPDELAKKNLADAIAAHPQLTTLADAISGGLNPRVNIKRELDAGEFTAFAPTDAAFAKLPKKTLAALKSPKSAEALTDLLLFHFVVGERDPGAVTGTLKTRGGSTLKVTGDGDRIRVGDQANVVCGGIQTANATLYLIDTVLVPPH